jgi:hypothetical protein
VNDLILILVLSCQRVCLLTFENAAVFTQLGATRFEIRDDKALLMGPSFNCARDEYMIVVQQISTVRRCVVGGRFVNGGIVTAARIS